MNSYPYIICLISALDAGALRKWRIERGWDPSHPTRRIFDTGPCEHIVVLNKRDLVPEWGTEVRKFSSIGGFILRLVSLAFPEGNGDEVP